MNIVDKTAKYEKQNSVCNHAAFFPKNIRCIIAGASGCGKTNLLVNLLENGVLDYADVYIYSSTLPQPAYDYLKKYYGRIEKVAQQTLKKVVKIAHFYNSDEEIKDPKDLDENKSHIMIFDDVMNNNQKVIKDYFCAGRHNNVNMFYLCQSLHQLPKHGIRQNANIFILFKQDQKTLKYFHETNISIDMDFDEFKTFCEKAWRQKYGFVVINLWEYPYFGRYLANYTEIYTPSKYIKIHKNT